MHWSFKYVGLPYDDFNCWELVRYVYDSEWGVALPEYAGDYLDEEESEIISALIAGESSKPETWTVVAKKQDSNLVQFMPPKEGDVLWSWIASPRHPSHVGVVVDETLMLHTRKATGAIVQSYRDRITSPKVEGIYRHVRML